jgi:hypothetical protein
MFETTVNDDLTVTVTIDGLEVDRPGPWGDLDGAHLWADAMLDSLNAGDIHYPQQENP